MDRRKLERKTRLVKRIRSELSAPVSRGLWHRCEGILMRNRVRSARNRFGDDFTEDQVSWPKGTEIEFLARQQMDNRLAEAKRYLSHDNMGQVVATNIA